MKPKVVVLATWRWFACRFLLGLGLGLGKSSFELPFVLANLSLRETRDEVASALTAVTWLVRMHAAPSALTTAFPCFRGFDLRQSMTVPNEPDHRSD
jgi:hypothetical protein